MMSVASVNAYQGVMTAFADADKASRTIVRGFSGTATEPPTDVREDEVVGALVDLSKAQTSLKANVAVARTADEMTGTLLDLLA